MVLHGLIYNVALLLALGMVYGLTLRRWRPESLRGRFVFGLMFGLAAIAGMETPVQLMPGVVFDGRSILMSLAGLFGGVPAAAIASMLAAFYRIWLGGTGALTGVFVILSSALLGLGYHEMLRRRAARPTPLGLLLFGLLVSGVMLACMVTLPAGQRWQVLRSISLPVLLVYPVGTVLLGMLLLNQDAHLRAEVELQTAKEQAEKNERYYHTMLNTMGDPVFVKDAESRLVLVNDAFCEAFALSRSDILGKTLAEEVAPQEMEHFLKIDREVLATGREHVTEETLTVRGRDKRFVSTRKNRFEDASGTVFLLGVVRDMTERNQLREQLMQAQKLESVGRLAGGVAHDFNNLLMGIMNYVELCRDGIEPDHPIRAWLDEVTHDAERSAALVRQLLAFARKQTIAPVVMDLNEAVTGMLRMLQRLIGEDINLLWQPAAALPSVKMDPAQLDQILVNLCVNARDAIEGVGRITIETAKAHINDEYCAEHAEALPGDYTVLVVSDDGSGMDSETLANIFEPFFTTKSSGEGTGLGLATIYGIVKQNGGFVNVYSEPGQGSTFRMYLPRCEEGAPGEARSAMEAPRVGGDETILLVEDEKSVRVTTRMFLQDLGYTVLAAEDPDEALRLAKEQNADVHLVITDVVMPGMNGRELAAKLVEAYPRLRCLFMSGYTANVIAHRGILEEDVHFLSKPFNRDELAHKVRMVLDEQSCDPLPGSAPSEDVMPLTKDLRRASP